MMCFNGKIIKKAKEVMGNDVASGYLTILCMEEMGCKLEAEFGCVKALSQVGYLTEEEADTLIIHSDDVDENIISNIVNKLAEKNVNAVIHYCLCAFLSTDKYKAGTFAYLNTLCAIGYMSDEWLEYFLGEKI